MGHVLSLCPIGVNLELVILVDIRKEVTRNPENEKPKAGKMGYIPVDAGCGY